MELQDHIAVVTGGGNGIGAALACRLAGEGARGVVVSDIDLTAAREVAERIVAAGGRAVAQRADVRVRADIDALVVAAQKHFGGLDLFCSNAGVAQGTGVHATDDQWQLSWEVNVRQHVYAAQASLPAMLPRRRGHLLLTVSAAGLVGAPGDVPYAVTKHAAIGLAESLAVALRPRGIGVSALCPLGVRTDLLVPGIAAGHPAALNIAAAGELLEPSEVAETTVQGLRKGSFLILPHASVGASYAARAADPDGWIDQVVADFAAATRQRN